jgi:hypothetical protein
MADIPERPLLSSLGQVYQPPEEDHPMSKRKAKPRPTQPESERVAKQVLLRLRPETIAQLDALARRWRVTRSGAVGMMLEREEQNYERPVPREGHRASGFAGQRERAGEPHAHARARRAPAARTYARVPAEALVERAAAADAIAAVDELDGDTRLLERARGRGATATRASRTWRASAALVADRGDGDRRVESLDDEDGMIVAPLDAARNAL